MNQPILFYDGTCGFCQWSVQLVLEHEKLPTFYFASLQSDFAKKHLPKALTKDLNSVVVLDNQRIFTQSDAVIKVASTLSFPYSLAKIGQFIPKSVRNTLYQLVAQNRQKLSPVSKKCRILTKEERMRFIE